MNQNTILWSLLFKFYFWNLVYFQTTFASIIRQAGFQMVTYENLTFGVTAIHSGFKLWHDSTTYCYLFC